jgi:hypothetical protein
LKARCSGIACRFARLRLVIVEGCPFSRAAQRWLLARIDDPMKRDYIVNAVVARNRDDPMLQFTGGDPYVVKGGSKTDPSPMTCEDRH